MSTEALERVTSQYAQIEAGARAMVEARNKARKYNADFIPVLIERLEQYRRECEETNKPLTSAGFIMASGLPSKTYYEMANGDYDHVIEEYRLIHNIPQDVEQVTDDDGVVIPLAPFSQIIENLARLPLQQQLESNCYNTQRGVNPAGSIFGLKARFNWREDNGTQYIDKAVIIADGEQARKSLKMLME